MDQLVVLQEIYASFSKGGEGLQKIDAKDIAGSYADQVAKLLEGSKKGRIDEDVCENLSGSLKDVYEIKRLGDICRKAGLHALAIKSYNRALTLSRDPILRPVLLNNLGQAYARQGDLSRSAVYYQKAVSGFEVAGDQSGMAHVLGNLGSAYRRKRDWENAIEYSYRSLKTFQESGDALGAAQMTGSLGRVYAEMGERDLAARYFERSLSDFQKLGDKKSAAWVLDRMGKIACEREDYDRALGFYNQSLSLFQEQGCSQSEGVVLSDLGRMYLQMGEATPACEALERAVRLIPRSMQPSCQNALSGLAAAYSVVGKGYLADAEDGKAKNDASELTARTNASKSFARSSDRFLELASSLKGDMPAIKAAAGIARSRSYLAKISSKTTDEEAMALAERAQSALDLAGANSDEQAKAKIESLKRTLSGMKEARSIGLLGSEPWRLAKAVTSAGEYLMGGACMPGEANGHLCSALRNLSASVDAESGRKDPAEKLKAAAADLRRAESRFSAAQGDQDKQSASRISRAAKIVEGLAGAGSASVPADSSASSAPLKDKLNFKPEREALLLICEILADNALLEVDNTEKIYTWDDSLNLVEEMPERNASIHPEILGLEAQSSETGPQQDLTAKASLGLSSDSVLANEPILRMQVERTPAQEMVLADDVAKSSGIFVSEAEDPEECWLVPVKASMACSSHGQILLIQDDPLVRKNPEYKSIEIVEPTVQEHEMQEPIKEIPDQNDNNQLPGSNGISEPDKTPSPDARAGASDDSAAQDLLSALRQSSAKDGLSDKGGLFSQENAITLVKSLGVVVFLLLAVEAILYLI
jgi:tetratricopeptide (TPR) repeat protein